MSSDWLFVSQGVWTVHPLALRVALSPCKSLSNSPALAEGETLPLSNIDSEVGQEPRGWELGCSHRGARRPLEAEAEKTVSRIGVGPLKTDVLLTKQWHVTNVQPNMDIYDCGVRRNFQDPRNFLRIWCNCMKQIFPVDEILHMCRYVGTFFFHPQIPECSAGISHMSWPPTSQLSQFLGLRCWRGFRFLEPVGKTTKPISAKFGGRVSSGTMFDLIQIGQRVQVWCL